MFFIIEKSESDLHIRISDKRDGAPNIFALFLQIGNSSLSSSSRKPIFAKMWWQVEIHVHIHIYVGQIGAFLVFSFMLMDEIMVTDMTKQGLPVQFLFGIICSIWRLA